MKTLRDMDAVIDTSSSTLSIANNLVTVPLIQRFSPTNIVRTIGRVTVKPFHEVRLPVRISQNYTLGPSLIEPLVKTRQTPYIVAATLVEPTTWMTVCQLVNLSHKQYTIPGHHALATITPVDLLTNVEPNSQLTHSQQAVENDNAQTHA